MIFLGLALIPGYRKLILRKIFRSFGPRIIIPSIQGSVNWSGKLSKPMGMNIILKIF